MIPTGIGLYTRKLRSGRQHARDLAKRFSDHGLSWVAIGGPWHDPKRTGLANPPDRVARYAAEFQRKDVAAWLWGYPWWDRVDRFLEDLERCSRRIRLDGWLLDPELGMKGRPAESEAMVDAALATDLVETVGWTSYGLIRGHSRGPRALAIEQWCRLDFGSPQLYTRDSAIPTGLEQWARLGEVVPSFGLFRRTLENGRRRYRPKTVAQLDRHLGAFISSPVRIHGLLGWELAFMRPSLWKVLAKWSDWLARGVCAMPPALT
jgi:hypothetical protein